MKHTLLILLFFNSIRVFAQPQALNYQGVARDAQGHPLVNQNVSIRLSILDSTNTGQAIYVESHSTITNGSGLFNLSIGIGTVESGTFTTIPWGKGDKWLKMEMDVAGGSNYQLIGTTQFLSVPYALQAGRSSDSFVHYIGEQFGGGIVFHVYKMGGVEHGLIVSLTDLGNPYLGTEKPYSNITNIEIGSSAQSRWNGLSNSFNIVGQVGHTNSAAKVCLDYTYTDATGTFDDWHLPAIDELALLNNQQFIIDKYFPSASLLDYGYGYLSSTEVPALITEAYCMKFETGIISILGKSATGVKFRPIRSF